jgi:hypothetical protein
LSIIRSAGRPAALVLALAVALVAPAAASAASKKPVVVTGAAADIQPSTVTLTGSVRPRGAQTTHFFQIGLNRLYGTTTPGLVLARNAGRTRVTAPVTGLVPATTYHYRVVAQNRNGLVFGKDRTFRTRRQPLGLVLGASQNPVGFNGSTTLTGQLTGTGNAGRQVQLQANPWPFTQGFVNVGNPLVTDANGSFAFPILAVPINTWYRVQMPERPAVVSPILGVGVQVSVSTKATPRKIRRDRRGRLKRVRFRGRITPAVPAGQPVAIQRLDRGGVWTTVATTTTRAANGLFSTYRRKVRVRHSNTFRVLANLPDGAYVANAGRSVKVRRLPAR